MPLDSMPSSPENARRQDGEARALCRAVEDLEHDVICAYEELLPHEGFETFLAHVTADDRDAVAREIERATETGSPWVVECRINRRDGALRWILATGSPLRGAQGERRGTAGIVQDITGRKRSEEELRSCGASAAFLARLGETLQPLADPVELQAAAASLLRDHLGANRVHYAEFERDGKHAVVVHDHPAGVPDRAGRHALADFPCLADETRAGRTFVVTDASVDSRLGPEERATYRALPVAALVVVPILQQGEVAAVLSVHRTTAHAWSPDEVRLIEETAARTSDAVLRTRAEGALRAGEERFREILQNLSEGYAILAPDWTYLFVNKVNAEQAQCRPEDMVGRTLFEVAPGFERSPIFEAFRRCMEQRTPQRVECAFTFKDGSSAWFEAVAEPVPEGIMVRAQDVTARKRDELALRESEALVRTIAENSTQALVLMDGAGRCTYWNPALLTMTGYKVYDLLETLIY